MLPFANLSADLEQEYLSDGVADDIITELSRNHSLFVIAFWAERYDRALKDVFAVQDEITADVTNAIVSGVAHAERRRALRKPPESLGVWEVYQRGLWHYVKFNRADNEKAREFSNVPSP